MEIKSSQRWDGGFNKGLNRIGDELGVSKVRCIGVYNGERRVQFGNVEVLPIAAFLKELWDGNILR